MRFTENRPLAYVVLALAVAAALIFGGGGALMDKREAVESRFYASSESISAELNEMRDNATALASIARKYPSANQNFLARLDQALETLAAAKDPAELYAASVELNAAENDCYRDLTSLTMSDADQRDATYKDRNFSSALTRISHDDYNELAARFNGELAAFPANLLGALRGVRALKPFA